MSKEKFMLHLPEGINLTTLTIPCTLQICPVSSSYIHYAPSLAPTSVLLSIFSILLLTHLYLFTKPRTAISSILISLGLALEVAGHAARIRLHSNPFLRSIYELNLFCLTTAPFFIAAAIYMCFGFAVRVYHANQNEKGSKVRRCVGLLCAWDVVSVGLQVGGSVYASLGPESSKVRTATIVLVVGLATQVASLLVFGIVAAEHYRRMKSSRGGQKDTNSQDRRVGDATEIPNVKLILCALAMATLTLLTRAIFRLVEFSSEGGWNSKLANDEAAFMVLDSLMVCIACGALTIGCVFIGKGRREGLEREGEGKDVDWEGRESVES